MKMTVLLLTAALAATQALAAPANSKLQCMPSVADNSKGKLAFGHMKDSKMVLEHYLTAEGGTLKPTSDTSSAQQGQMYVCQNMPPAYSISDPATNGMIKLGDGSSCLTVRSDNSTGSSGCASSIGESLEQQWFQLNGPRLAHIGNTGDVLKEAAAMHFGKITLNHCETHACKFLYLE